MPNPSILESERAYSDKMTDMTLDIHNKLDGALRTVLEEFLDKYEPITYDSEFNAVEHEPMSGFVPLTEGGFHTLVIYRADQDNTYCPSIFDLYIHNLVRMAQEDFYLEQVEERAESTEELDKYFDKLFDSETGLDEDKELYYEFEREYMDEANPGLEIAVLYYAKDNVQNDTGHDAIRISVQTNTDAPYYRDGKGLSIYDKWFKIDKHSPSVVSLHLQNTLNEI